MKNPNATFADILAQYTQRFLCLTDFDLTIYTPDIGQVGIAQFGSNLPGTQKRRWEAMDDAYKLPGTTIKMGDLIEFALQECIAGAGSLDAFVEWLKTRHSLIPGVPELMRFLGEYGILPFGATNGSVQIAARMLEHHHIVMPFVGNSLNLSGGVPTLDCFHNREEGVRKGDLVIEAEPLGKKVVLCCGDSKGDISMAYETARRGGLVLARTGLGLADFLRKNVPSSQWAEYDDFRDVLPWLADRLPSVMDGVVSFDQVATAAA